MGKKILGQGYVKGTLSSSFLSFLLEMMLQKNTLMCPSEVYVIVLRMGFFTYLTRRCKVFCLMHIGLAHRALRWAKCFADLLLAHGEPSKHNVFPIQKAVVAR